MVLLRTSISCFALLAGAAALSIPLSDHAAAARGCSDNLNPVCGIRPDGPSTYHNACDAKAHGARVMHMGQCDTIVCTGVWPKVALQLGVVQSKPLCGIDPLTHAMMTYPNACAAESAQATWVHDGPCGGMRRRR